MEVPRFSRTTVSPRLLDRGEDDAFQRFVADALRPRWPHLQVFPAAGKDGAIDLSQSGATRTVVECKLIGDDVVAVIKTRWGEVAIHLEKNLASADGPPVGQSQYVPWYRTDPVISEYVFCISASLKNQARRDDIKLELRTSITEFFQGLARKHSHLGHLLALEVHVIDWDDLVVGLPPHLVFRWFPKTRPNGLKPFGEDEVTGSFRAYLHSDKLPYYSRSEHLKVSPTPEGVSIPDEHDLLELLNQDRFTGLIVSGAGGVGKSRLMFELGHLARSRGATVLEVAGRLKPDAIESLAERLQPHDEVLLLIDYIETQQDFIQFVEEVESVNAICELHLRYVACCRSSYFSSIQHGGSSTDEFYHLDLAFDAAMEPWLQRYRSSTIRHILQTSGLADSPSYLEMCGQTPVLAVFLAWLHDNNRREELDELLTEKDFGQWFAKRIQKSFQQSVSAPLAQLVCLFPVSNEAAMTLRRNSTFDHLFQRLQIDGWIERTGSGSLENDLWETAHDVLADQIVLSYAGRLGAAADQFVLRVLDLATEHYVVESVLITLQRVSDHPPFRTLLWEELLRRAIRPDHTAWRKARNALLRTSLLTPPEQVRLLDLPNLWDGVEFDIEFQNHLGWLARAERKQPLLYDSKVRTLLKAWVLRAAPCVERCNFLLTYGLQFEPELVQEHALRWLADNPYKFQSHYLLVGWLKAELPLALVATLINLWCRKFVADSHLSFVVQEWLDAGGSRDLVEAPIKVWLNAGYDKALDAQFVYQSWLDAGGSRDLVEAPIKAWLNAGHEAAAEARFVYKSWLNTGGSRDLVEAPIKAWLNAGHDKTLDANFVYKSWLDAGGSHDLVEASIKAWLNAGHETVPDARFVYKSWLDAGGSRDLVEAPIKAWLNAGHRAAPEARFVYKSWLDAGGSRDLVEAPIKVWLNAGHETAPEARFVYKSWLDAGGSLDLVEAPIKVWLNAGHDEALDAGFVYTSWLNAGGSRDLVEAPIKVWLNAGHDEALDAGFVYTSWLDAGGSRDLVEASIKVWLNAGHETAPEARFVYKAWLNAGGSFHVVASGIGKWLAVGHAIAVDADYLYRAWLDSGAPLGVVSDAVSCWLEQHGTQLEASFVLLAWDDAGGHFNVIRDHAFAWLRVHSSAREGVYVTSAIAKQDTLPMLVVKDVLNWCRTFSEDENAIWRLSQLNNNLAHPSLRDELIATSLAILMPLLQSTRVFDTQERTNLVKAFSPLISHTRKLPMMDPQRRQVDELIDLWCRHPTTFVPDEEVNFVSESSYRACLFRIALRIADGGLTLDRDRAAIERIIDWFNSWWPEWKDGFYGVFVRLQRHYPDDLLWDRVRF